jgi:uncharacterized protein YtpQ (UPF0354 family)
MLRVGRRALFALGLISALPRSLGAGPALAKNRALANVAEFRELVIAAFKKQPGVTGVVADPGDPAKFRIAIGDWASTVDVTNIYNYLIAYPDEDVDKAIERIVRSNLDAKARVVADSNIVVVIRNVEYVNYLKAKGLELLAEPLNGDLMIVYMVDRPDAMSPIAPKGVPGKDLSTLGKIALDNVRRWLPKVVADDKLKPGVLYYVQDNTMLSTSLILLDEFWQSIETRFPGDVLIALPRKDQLFIFDDGNSAAKERARALIDVTTQENFNLLSQKLYARRSGKIMLAPERWEGSHGDSYCDPARSFPSLGTDLSRPTDASQRFPARNETADEGQEECLAEATDRWFGFQIERLADNIGIVFVEDDPQAEIRIKPGAAFLDKGDLAGETSRFRLLGRNREQQQQVAASPGRSDANRDRPVLAPLRLTPMRFPRPKVGIADDAGRPNVVVAHDCPDSSADS